MRIESSLYRGFWYLNTIYLHFQHKNNYNSVKFSDTKQQQQKDVVVAESLMHTLRLTATVVILYAFFFFT